MRNTIDMAREVELDELLEQMPRIAKKFKDFEALVRADERNSWPSEMEAMERQVNILTDALAAERAACCDAIWKCDGMGLEDRFIAMDVIKARGTSD